RRGYSPPSICSNDQPRRSAALAVHTVEPTRATLHGHFSRELAPILTIDPGDTIRYRLLDAGWGLEAWHADGTPRAHLEPRDPELDAGHALCGPIAVRGAEAGRPRVARTGRLRRGSYGWTAAGGWDTPVNTRLGLGAGAGEFALRWQLDPDRLIGHDQFGHEVALSPFLGVIGMPLAEPGRHPTPPPRPTGGNIDCKEL